VASGLIALIFLVFYATSHFLGFGEGGIERVVAYPQTVWLIVFGIYVTVWKPNSDVSLVKSSTTTSPN
jgi:hypothetical protein